MRLIDADEFKEIILTYGKAGYAALRIEKLSELIDGQSTSYDVDRVVEQLENLKRRYWFTIANTGDEKLDCAYENVGNALDKALEIVKSGGIEEEKGERE